MKNQSDSIDAIGFAVFFFIGEYNHKKIRRVGGKQAEPGVPSGF